MDPTIVVLLCLGAGAAVAAGAGRTRRWKPMQALLMKGKDGSMGIKLLPAKSRKKAKKR